MQRVLVIGGGIAGNTAAVALAQRGVECVIAEITATAFAKLTEPI